MTITLQVALTALLTMPLNLATMWDQVATARLAARVKAMRDAGEPTTMAELAKAYPDPPKGQNAAPLFNQAFKLMKERGDDDAGDLPLVGTGEMPDVAADFPPDLLADIQAYLRDNAKIIELLRKGAELEGCKFDLDFTKGPGMLLPHLSSMRQAARLLALEAIVRTETAKPDAAAESLRTTLRLGRALRREPVLITTLVRIACDAIAVGQVERWVSRSAPSPRALQRVEETLRAEADPSILKQVFLGERCFGMDIYQTYVLKPGGADTLRLLGAPDPHAWGLLRLVPRAYFKSDMVNYIDLMNAYVAAVHKPYPESFVAGGRVGRELEEKLTKSPARIYVVSRMILPALGRVFSTAQRHMAQLDSARLGLAALRYKAAHKRLPDTLDALVPDFIEAVPPDPFDGKPLRYRKEKGGFVIYALGENGADDAGDIERVNGKHPDVGFRVRLPKAQF